MLYMLGTDICSYIMKFHPIAVLEKLQEKVEFVVTYAELRLGAERSQHVDRYHHLIDEFMDRINKIEPWTREVADTYASLMAQFMRRGNQIGNNDTMIAAHALSLGACLISNNQKHFSRVPDLLLENWANQGLQKE